MTTTEQTGPEPTYTDTDRDEILFAAGVMTAAMRDIDHHEIGDAWDLYDPDTGAEARRLADRLSQMRDAVTEAQRRLDQMETGARLRTIWEPTLTAHGIPTVDSPEPMDSV
jgi:hypothetical protein